MKQFLFLSSLCLIFSLFLFSNIAHAQTAPVIDLVWEADGYTPAEYAGKPMVTIGSNVRVVALTDTKNLSYYWRLDDYELPDYSGPGKNSFSFKATKSAGYNHLVQLTVTQNGQTVGSRTLAIPVVAPLIAFYEEDPILGEVFNKAFTGPYQLPKSEITFVAEPFFFERAGVNSLKYTWKLNGQQVAADGGNGRVITFTTPSAGGKGTNEIKLFAENPNNAIQYAQGGFSIIFNSSPNDSAF